MEDGSSREAYVPDSFTLFFFFCTLTALVQNEITLRKLCTTGFVLDGNAGTHPPRTYDLGGNIRQSPPPPHHLVMAFIIQHYNGLREPGKGDLGMPREHAGIRWEMSEGALVGAHR